MSEAKKLTFPRQVETLRGCINRWRRTRQRMGPMPETCWTRATALAREHGVLRIARAVRIDFGALKRRVEAAAAEPEPRQPPTKFIELAPFASPGGEAVLDLADDSGRKMTLRITGHVELDVTALANAFWSRSEA